MSSHVESVCTHISMEYTRSYQPTNLAEAFQAMTFNPPDDTWYMDTGASSHLTNNAGTIKTASKSRINSSILIGNGSYIPFVAKG